MIAQCRFLNSLLFVIAIFISRPGAAHHKHALVIVNYEGAPLGNLEPHLRDHGYHIRQVPGSQLSQQDVARARKSDLLIVLGGLQSARDIDKVPSLRKQVDALRHRHEHNRPSLGICLGSQLMALALGGKVKRAPSGREFGLKPLQLTSAGQTSEVMRKLTGARVVQSHSDVFELPPNIATSASTSMYPNQAFEVGKSLAVQFHPEVLGPEVRQWMTLFKIPAKEMPESDFDYLKNQWQQVAAKFWTTWLAKVS